MKPCGSLLCSQEDATDFCCVLDESSTPLTSQYLNILFKIVLPSTQGLPSGLFLSGFQTKILYSVLISSMRATCPAHLMFFVL
jgi:hypothetical protein